MKRRKFLAALTAVLSLTMGMSATVFASTGPETEWRDIPVTADMITSNAEQKGDGSIANLLDGSPTTHFHSRYMDINPSTEKPHYLQIDLGEEKEVAGVRFQSRWTFRNGELQCDERNCPTQYSVLGSHDGQEWFTIFATGDQSTEVPQDMGTWVDCTADYATQTARYVRFVVEQTLDTQKYPSKFPYFSLGELRVQTSKLRPVSDVTVSDITHNSAVIHFNSPEMKGNIMEYDIVVNGGRVVGKIAEPGTPGSAAYSYEVTGLTPSTHYVFGVQSMSQGYKTRIDGPTVEVDTKEDPEKPDPTPNPDPTPAPDPTPTPDNTTPTPKPVNVTTNTKAPQTGDAGPLAPTVLLALSGAAAAVALKKRR